MNQANLKLLAQYILTIEKELAAGNATEHTHRPAFKTLVEDLAKGVTATNEPQRIECGAPDFIITKGSATIGYIEAKDIGKSLDEAEKSEQLQRYLGSLTNLILTDYLESRWYVDGKCRLKARLGTPARDSKIRRDKGGAEAVAALLGGFLSHRAERVGTPKELAERMARQAHMIRNLIVAAFGKEPEGGSLHTQLVAFRDNLIPDLSVGQFADMYAQTLAYGLFAARCTSKNGASFTRLDAAINLPRTNLFLRKLFQYIAGYDLDYREPLFSVEMSVGILHCRIRHLHEQYKGSQNPVFVVYIFQPVYPVSHCLCYRLSSSLENKRVQHPLVRCQDY